MMKSRFITLLGSVFALLLCTAVVFVWLLAPSARAVASKTYTLNSASSFNYERTGSVAVDTGTTANWFDAAWQYRQKITIKKDFIGDTLEDFPILIRLSETVVHQHARSDKYDILFTASDGMTKLAHEREDKNNYWVKVPQLTSSEDIVLYLYYGNAKSSDQQDAAQVWTNEFAAVYHLNEDPGGLTLDSTARSVDGTSQGGLNHESLQSGKIGPAYNFIRTAQQSVITSFTPAQLNIDGRKARSISAWANVRTFDDGGVIDMGGTTAVSQFTLRSEDGSGNWRAQFEGTDLDFVVNNHNSWGHIVMQYDGQQAKVYSNGAFNVSRAIALNTTNTRPLSLGRWTTNQFFDGLIDEVRVSTTVRSSAWIRAEYANQCDCEDFLTISDEVETHSYNPVNADEVATIQLKSDRPLSFASLVSFVPNGSDTITYQLSNDAGKTWYFYGSSKIPQARPDWKSANAANPFHRSSARDINRHIDSFPSGQGKLLWKAYLPAGTSLDSVMIDYIRGGTSVSKSAVSSLADPRIKQINSLFRVAFNREPSFEEWLFWTNRLINGEKATAEELLGAMQHAALSTP